MDNEENGSVLEVTAESGSERLHLPPKKRLLIIACAVGAALITAAVVITVLAVRSAPRKPIRTFFAAVQNADGALFVEALPQCVTDRVSAERGDPAAYFEENMLRDSLKELEEDYGERVRISFGEEQRIGLDPSEISALCGRLRESCGDIAVDKAYDLQVSYTIKGSHKTETKSREFTVCKTGGKWVMADVPNTII